MDMFQMTLKFSLFTVDLQVQWLIQDFPEEGAPIPKLGLFCQFFAENCMKMKEFGPRGGEGVRGSANEV